MLFFFNPCTSRLLKQTGRIAALLITLAFSACEPELHFEEPQPPEDNNEPKFKHKFQGRYLCLEDSSILTVEKNRVIQQWRFETRLTKTQIDTTPELELKDGSLYTEGQQTPFSIALFGDTVVISQDFEQKLFEISNDRVLRYFKGIYFLNYGRAQSMWTVKTMALDRNGILTIHPITGGVEELERIKEIVPVQELANDDGKGVDYKIHPTKKEWKALLRSDLFQEGRRFQKIK